MDEPKANPALDLEKHQLDVARFEFEKQKHELERMGKAVEWRQTQNVTISQLLHVVTYLNGLQDKQVTVLEEGHQRTTITTEAREWNPHEEEIANASLMTLTRLIKSLNPEPVTSITKEAASNAETR